MPPETPVTRPIALTVATAALLLLHVPPLAVSLSVVAVPAQNVVGEPVIVPALAPEITVTASVAVSAPQPLVTIY